MASVKGDDGNPIGPGDSEEALSASVPQGAGRIRPVQGGTLADSEAKMSRDTLRHYKVTPDAVDVSSLGSGNSSKQYLPSPSLIISPIHIVAGSVELTKLDTKNSSTSLSFLDLANFSNQNLSFLL